MMRICKRSMIMEYFGFLGRTFVGTIFPTKILTNALKIFRSCFISMESEDVSESRNIPRPVRIKTGPVSKFSRKCALISSVGELPDFRASFS